MIPRIVIYRGEGLQHSARLSRPVLLFAGSAQGILGANDLMPGNYSLHVEYGNGKKRHFNFYVEEDLLHTSCFTGGGES